MSHHHRTFAIIKPDAVEQQVIHAILGMAAEDDLVPVWMRMVEQPVPKAFWRRFYEEHSSRPYFGELVEFMASGPCVFVVLETVDPFERNAIADWRVLMGATKREEAAPGTIRRIWGGNGPRTAVHGSDSAEAYAREISLVNSLVSGLITGLGLPG